MSAGEISIVLTNVTPDNVLLLFLGQFTDIHDERLHAGLELRE